MKKMKTSKIHNNNKNRKTVSDGLAASPNIKKSCVSPWKFAPCDLHVPRDLYFMYRAVIRPEVGRRYERKYKVQLTYTN